MFKDKGNNHANNKRCHGLILQQKQNILESTIMMLTNQQQQKKHHKVKRELDPNHGEQYDN